MIDTLSEKKLIKAAYIFVPIHCTSKPIKMKPHTFPFKKIDAFATEKSSGNPAGYIWLDSLADISEGTMLQIAKELKGFVNEVGYVAQVGEQEFDLRYYSSEREVDFCGHATVAIMYDIIQTRQGFADHEHLTINIKRARLTVENKVDEEDAVFVMSPAPIVKERTPSLEEIAQKLKIAPSDIDQDLPIRIINAGISTLLVPITDLQAILNISPELDELKEFCFASNIDIIEVFTSDVHNKASDFRTRVFSPTYGYLEDPATGSGNSAFGYYLLQNHLWEEEIITIEQNGTLDTYNVVKLKKQLDENQTERVCFGGGAITRIEGSYLIHS